MAEKNPKTSRALPKPPPAGVPPETPADTQPPAPPEAPLGGSEHFFLERGRVKPDALARARREKMYDEHIGEALVRLHLLDAKSFNEAMLTLGSDRRIEKIFVDPEILITLAPKYQALNRVLPLYREGEKLHYVHAGTPDPHVLADLRQQTGATVLRGVEIGEDLFLRLFRRHHPKVKIGPAAPQGEAPTASPGRPGAAPAVAETPAPRAVGRERESIDTNEEDPQVIGAVNGIIRGALERRATDIHIEPGRDNLRVRFRVDGNLVEQGRFPDQFTRAFAGRIKVMAGMKTHISFMPQSGSLSLMLEGRTFEMRVSVLPTVYGEAVVLRVLPQGGAEVPLEERGMAGTTLQRFNELIRRSAGILLVTGPTGSGKTSTLFSALHRISTPDLKVITLEDPAEYKLDGLIQSSVDVARGYGFADGLREILRHDPDVILVGEIRDRETATIAVQAALTGHLVLSTLHTIDAPSAITRLIDIGVPVYQIEAALAGVLAQRLVRRLCPACAQAVEVTEEAITRHGLVLAPGRYTLKRPRGCAECQQTGFRERVGIFELMVMSVALRELLRTGAGVDAMRAQAVREGMVPLLDYGKECALQGVTTIDEVIAACR